MRKDNDIPEWEHRMNLIAGGSSGRTFRVDGHVLSFRRRRFAGRHERRLNITLYGQTQDRGRSAKTE